MQNLSVERVHTNLLYSTCQRSASSAAAGVQRYATMPDATASPLHGTSGDDLSAPPLPPPAAATAPDGTDAPPSEATQTKRAAGVRRILRQSRPEWPAMAAATLCLVLAVLGQAVMPLLFGRMVDATSDTSGSRDARLRRYSAACAELALVVGVSLFFTAVRAYVFNSAGAKLCIDHGLHAIDVTPARRRGSAGASPLDGASTAAFSSRKDSRARLTG